MYLTEAEAGEKWCPMGLLDACGENVTNCIASRCMAWRWDTPSKFQALKKYRDEHNCSLCEAKEYVDREHPELTMEKTHGYCGLAGRP